MPIIERIAEFQDDLTACRRDIHAHPETAFQEHRTAEVVARTLAGMGIEVCRGIAGTGVVGTLHGNRPGQGRAIGLRADLDALNVEEKNTFDHRSVHPGKMHACGHDGHTAMLLGAARYLAETRDFAGTVYLIFQPAEEGQAGGRAMIEDGLFERFPVEAVFGMHNLPGLPVGAFGVNPAAMLAAMDNFDLVVKGRGAHAGMPHLGVDPVVVAAQIIMGLQTITSRMIDPLQPAVISVTWVEAGAAYNVIPDEAVLRGTVRTLSHTVRATMEGRIRAVADGIASAAGAAIELRYEAGYPPTINTPAEAEIAAGIAAKVVGEANVQRDFAPLMGSEDFAFMLQEKPGAYVFIGNGPGEGGCALHNPHYDFNDQLLPIGGTYWATLVETILES